MNNKSSGAPLGAQEMTGIATAIRAQPGAWGHRFQLRAGPRCHRNRPSEWVWSGPEGAWWHLKGVWFGEIVTFQLHQRAEDGRFGIWLTLWTHKELNGNSFHGKPVGLSQNRRPNRWPVCFPLMLPPTRVPSKRNTARIRNSQTAHT